MELVKGKVVANYPHVIPAGNTWISDVVYQLDKNYYVTKSVVEQIGYGPREIGEEVEVIHRPDNALAEDWMIETYNNPKAYKSAMMKRKMENDRRLVEARTVDEPEEKKHSFLNIVIILLVIAIIGALAFIILS